MISGALGQVGPIEPGDLYPTPPDPEPLPQVPWPDQSLPTPATVPGQTAAPRPAPDLLDVFQRVFDDVNRALIPFYTPPSRDPAPAPAPAPAPSSPSASTGSSDLLELLLFVVGFFL